MSTLKLEYNFSINRICLILQTRLLFIEMTSNMFTKYKILIQLLNEKIKNLRIMHTLTIQMLYNLIQLIE